MKILNRIKDRFSTDVSAAVTFAIPTDMSALLDTDTDHIKTIATPKEVIKLAYGLQLAAGNAIAESMMGIDYYMAKLVKDTWQVEANHRIQSLLENPNDFNSGEELKFIIALDIFFLGESFLEIVRDGLGNVDAIYPMYGSTEVLKVDKETKVPAVYKNVVGDKTREIDAKDIIHIRRPKLQSRYGGMGDVMGASKVLNIVGKLQESQYKLYKQGVFPAGFLLVGGNAKAKEREALQKEIKERHSGVDNFAKIIPLNAENVKYQEVSRSPKDMMFSRDTRELREEILMLLRIPAPLLGKVEASSRAAMESMEYWFAKYRLNPLVQLIVSNLNKELVLPDYGEEYKLVSEEVVPEDKEYELKKTEMYLDKGVLTIDEVRAREGIDKL